MIDYNKLALYGVTKLLWCLCEWPCCTQDRIKCFILVAIVWFSVDFDYTQEEGLVNLSELDLASVLMHQLTGVQVPLTEVNDVQEVLSQYHHSLLWVVCFIMSNGRIQIDWLATSTFWEQTWQHWNTVDSHQCRVIQRMLHALGIKPGSRSAWTLLKVSFPIR